MLLKHVTSFRSRNYTQCCFNIKFSPFILLPTRERDILLTFKYTWPSWAGTNFQFDVILLNCIKKNVRLNIQNIEKSNIDCKVIVWGLTNVWQTPFDQNDRSKIYFPKLTITNGSHSSKFIAEIKGRQQRTTRAEGKQQRRVSKGMKKSTKRCLHLISQRQ